MIMQPSVTFFVVNYTAEPIASETPRQRDDNSPKLLINSPPMNLTIHRAYAITRRLFASLSDSTNLSKDPNREALSSIHLIVACDQKVAIRASCWPQPFENEVKAASESLVKHENSPQEKKIQFNDLCCTFALAHWRWHS